MLEHLSLLEKDGHFATLFYSFRSEYCIFSEEMWRMQQPVYLLQFPQEQFRFWLSHSAGSWTSQQHDSIQIKYAATTFHHNFKVPCMARKGEVNCSQG